MDSEFRLPDYKGFPRSSVRFACLPTVIIRLQLGTPKVIERSGTGLGSEIVPTAFQGDKTVHVTLAQLNHSPVKTVRLTLTIEIDSTTIAALPGLHPDIAMIV